MVLLMTFTFDIVPRIWLQGIFIAISALRIHACTECQIKAKLFLLIYQC